MNDDQQACFICHSEDITLATDDYMRCSKCGHETLIHSDQQHFIINNPLEKSDVFKLGGLDKFKNKIVRHIARKEKLTSLLDIGSASGKFLYQNKDFFTHTYGLEVTEQAIKFSRQELGLNIYEGIDAVPKNYDLVTAWHSLEHIPANELQKVLKAVSENMSNNGRFIISVPNADSLQYKRFKKSYAYYDVPNHLHQYSRASLNTIMSDSGFVLEQEWFSTPYNTFGNTQGLLNLFSKPHNYLYYRLKRKSATRLLKQDLLNLFLLPPCLLIGLFMTAQEILQPRKQGVITQCFKKIKP